MKPQCETCRFWDRYEARSGPCRRRSPQKMTWDDDNTGWGYWPFTFPDDWCGEYEPAEDDLNQELYSMASR